MMENAGGLLCELKRSQIFKALSLVLAHMWVIIFIFSPSSSFVLPVLGINKFTFFFKKNGWIRRYSIPLKYSRLGLFVPFRLTKEMKTPIIKSVKSSPSRLLHIRVTKQKASACLTREPYSEAQHSGAEGSRKLGATIQFCLCPNRVKKAIDLRWHPIIITHSSETDVVYSLVWNLQLWLPSSGPHLLKLPPRWHHCPGG